MSQGPETIGARQGPNPRHRAHTHRTTELLVTPYGANLESPVNLQTVEEFKQMQIQAFSLISPDQLSQL